MSKPSPRANVPKNNEVIRRRVHTPHERQSHVENDPDHGHEDDYAEPTYAHKQNILRRVSLKSRWIEFWERSLSFPSSPRSAVVRAACSRRP